MADADGFERDVCALVRLVPRGRVTTYGAVARAVGKPGASRRVGWVLHTAGAVVPAHRVVNRLGLLTGATHFPEDRPMADLLTAEGVRVEQGCVVEFKRLFWDPNQALQ